MKKIILLVFLSLLSTIVFSAMHKQEISYQHGGVELKSYLFQDDAFKGKRPAVMVFHERWGMNDYVLLRAEMLAEAGYIALAVDMYGDGRRTRSVDEADKWMKQLTGNKDLWQQRVISGYKQLLKVDGIDSMKVAAVGYSFGGSTALQMAYSGVDISGVISVHGNLPPVTANEAKNIKAKVLVLHGDLDDIVPKKNIEQLSSALTGAEIDWEMNVYGGAMKSFSNPYASGYGLEGVEFNEVAEQRSWARTLSFLEELFVSEDY